MDWNYDFEKKIEKENGRTEGDWEGYTGDGNMVILELAQTHMGKSQGMCDYFCPYRDTRICLRQRQALDLIISSQVAQL